MGPSQGCGTDGLSRRTQLSAIAADANVLVWGGLALYRVAKTTVRFLRVVQICSTFPHTVPFYTHDDTTPLQLRKTIDMPAEGCVFACFGSRRCSVWQRPVD